jgi:hypothetical protein
VSAVHPGAAARTSAAGTATAVAGTAVASRAERWEMPTVFGPSLIPGRSEWGRVDMVSIGFTTTRAAAAALVPPGIEVVGDEPAVTVSRMTYTDVDYLPGGGYNEVTVGIAARADDGGATVTGNFMPVVWVDETVPILIGREGLGYAKVAGELPPVSHGDHGADFELRERGTLLLGGSVRELAALPADRLAAVRRAGGEITVLGWKYIPGLGDEGPDADYPTAIPLSFTWAAAAAGAGTLAFGSPTWEQAPVAARIIEALAALPMVRSRRALVATGHGAIDRTRARRLWPREHPVAGDAG